MTHWIATVITLIVIALLITFGVHDIVRYHCETSDGLLLFRGIALIILALFATFGMHRGDD